MKKIILPLAGVMIVLAGCQSSSNKFEADSNVITSCVGDKCSVVSYTSPDGNDLVLETAKHVIEIQGQQDVPYSYYVWTGGKDTSDDPDLIVADGQAMVLVEE